MLSVPHNIAMDMNNVMNRANAKMNWEQRKRALAKGRQGPLGEKRRHVMLEYAKYMKNIAWVLVANFVSGLKHATKVCG